MYHADMVACNIVVCGVAVQTLRQLQLTLTEAQILQTDVAPNAH